MNGISLTRNQIMQLAELAEKFSDTEWFTIHEEFTSGIGHTTEVKFRMYKDSSKDFDTTVDITDLSTW
jgi:hypothetical protein